MTMGKRRWVWGCLMLMLVFGACEWTSPTYPTQRPPLPTARRVTPLQSATPQPTLSPTPWPTATITPEPAPHGLVYQVLPIRAEVIPGQPLWLQTTTDGTLWLVTDKAVLRLRTDQKWWLPYLQGYPGKVIGIDDRWRVWVWDEEAQEVRCWDSNNWTHFGKDQGWLPVQGEVRPHLWTDATGGLWVMTDGDVRRLDGSRWSVYTPSSLGMKEVGAEETLTLQLIYWPERKQMWLGSCVWAGPQAVRGAGLRWFDGKDWQPEPVLEQECVLNMAVAQGRLWLAGMGTVYVSSLTEQGAFEKQRIQTGPSGLKPAYVLDFAFAQDGSAWGVVALCGGASCDSVRAVYRLRDDGEWQALGEVNPFLIQVVHNGLDDSIWALGQDRLYRYPVGGDGFQTLPPLHMIMVTEDQHSGQVWVLAVENKQPGLWSLGKEE